MIVADPENECGDIVDTIAAQLSACLDDLDRLGFTISALKVAEAIELCRFTSAAAPRQTNAASSSRTQES